MSQPGKIQKLDEVVINRIAAGEVIQRPANALKEMIENSLDARATNIQVAVKNGGLKLLQIQDNGSGIRRDDFEIVCERFTTSKLREYEDLNTIATYGFRGEALASISHVAHLTIQSKTSNEKCAYKASYEDGKLKEAVKPTAGNQGTQITVEDLFYNMNVRKKSLRSSSEEYQKISDVVGKYAIHNANVGFSLKKQGENVDIRTPPNSNPIDNIRTIYGNSIARELIEFNLENEPFKFKVRGFVTNVNYSTKKLQFLLFINHRLVDCQSLKKCVDQIYTTYLPKNAHPFVYLSLELDPRSIDVNVHPTKHEVHFLNEEQIIDTITTSLESKLLGSNNSRVFYTQAKLPVLQNEEIATEINVNRTIHDKDFVRTDATVQKLDKFFGAAFVKKKASKINDKKTIADVSLDEIDFVQHNEAFLKRNEAFEDKLLEKTAVVEEQQIKETIDLSDNLISKVTKYDTELLSVLELRKEIEEDCHVPLRQLFSQHVFVGCVDTQYTLLQHNTKLYLCDNQKLMEELFYQFLVYHFQHFDSIRLCNPLPIYDLSVVALELPETGWTPEDGDKVELAKKIVKILAAKGTMLSEYFKMEIDENGVLKSLPTLLDNHMPEISGLPLYILRLATEVNWETEKECFRTFARETATYYSQIDETNENNNWKWTVEHVVYPAIKDYFLPPKNFTENTAVLQVADLPSLYKVFERC